MATSILPQGKSTGVLAPAVNTKKAANPNVAASPASTVGSAVGAIQNSTALQNQYGSQTTALANQALQNTAAYDTQSQGFTTQQNALSSQDLALQAQQLQAQLGLSNQEYANTQQQFQNSQGVYANTQANYGIEQQQNQLQQQSDTAASVQAQEAQQRSAAASGATNTIGNYNAADSLQQNLINQLQGLQLSSQQIGLQQGSAALNNQNAVLSNTNAGLANTYTQQTIASDLAQNNISGAQLALSSNQAAASLSNSLQQIGYQQVLNNYSNLDSQLSNNATAATNEATLQTDLGQVEVSPTNTSVGTSNPSGGGGFVASGNITASTNISGTGLSLPPATLANIKTSFMNTAANMYGWSSASDQDALNYVMVHESGYNPTALNASGAYGIGQTLGHGNGAGSDTAYGQGNVAAQIQWTLSYIKGRYGTPQAAMEHEQIDGWY